MNVSNGSCVSASCSNYADDSADSAASDFLLNFSLYWVCIVAPVAIVLNVTAMITFLRVRDILPTSTRMLMIHQTYIEICTSSVGIFQQITRHVTLYYPPNLVGQGLCITYNAAYWAYDICLQMNCVLITVDRYFAICCVMKRYLTPRRVAVLILAVQIIGWLHLYAQGIAIQRVDSTGYCHFLTDVALTRPWGIMYVMYETAPIICVFVVYPKMILALRRSSKQLHDASNTNNSSSTKSVATKRLLRTGLIAAVVLIVSNMPDVVFFSIMYAIMGDNPNYLNSWQQTIDISFKSVYPLMCPIIYSFSTPKFRTAVVTAFTKC